MSPSVTMTVVMKPKEWYQGKDTIKANGTKTQDKKRIIIGNLKEEQTCFKSTHPEAKRELFFLQTSISRTVKSASRLQKVERAVCTYVQHIRMSVWYWYSCNYLWSHILILISPATTTAWSWRSANLLWKAASLDHYWRKYSCNCYQQTEVTNRQTNPQDNHKIQWQRCWHHNRSTVNSQRNYLL
jgi:hypothetical protein